MITKRGQFFHFEFMESGVRVYGTFNGKKYQHAASKQEARELESALRVQVRGEIRDGSYGKDKTLDEFGEFFDRVYMPYAKQNTGNSKHAQFRGDVLKAFFVGKRFSEIKPMMIVQYINTRLATVSKRGTTFDPCTINKEIVLLSGIFKMAMSDGHAEVNPCDAIPKTIRKKLPARNKRERFLSDEEETKLFAKFVGRRAHLNAIVRFDLETGLRRSELCRLEVEHVNLSGPPRFIQIGNKRVELPAGCLLVARSKNGKHRIIPMSDEAKRIAEARIADAATKKFLFTSRRTGGMLSEVKTAFVGAVRDAGLEDFRFHDLRHTFASRLSMKADPFTIRDLMGHSSTQMTDSYTHTSIAQRREAIEGMGQSIGRVVQIDSVKITA